MAKGQTRKRKGNAAHAAAQAAKVIGKSGVGASKRKAALKGKAAKPQAKDFWTEHKHLFQKTPMNFGIGQNLPRTTDMSRVVKWPRYIRIQRQRAILKKRLKVPPPIHQFSQTLDKNQASKLFKLMVKYRPETRQEKKRRLYDEAKNEVEQKEKDPANKPRVLKYGLKHITHLIEEKKAKLVIIAHDVDPIELVVWLPTLCRKKDVPYCIVKNKSRLGAFVHQKKVAALAFTEVHQKDQAQFAQLTKNFSALYNEVAFGDWGGGVMGFKTTKRQEKLQRIRDAEAAQKLGVGAA